MLYSIGEQEYVNIIDKINYISPKLNPGQIVSLPSTSRDVFGIGQNNGQQNACEEQ